MTDDERFYLEFNSKPFDWDAFCKEWDKSWLKVNPEYLDRMKKLSKAVIFPSTIGDKMHIMQLRREDIPLVTEGGDQALVDEITEALDECEVTNCVLYVRYGPTFLQSLRVDREILFNHPNLDDMLHDEIFWDREALNITENEKRKS